MITESVVTSTRLSPVSIVTSVQEMSMFGARRRRSTKAAHLAKRGVPVAGFAQKSGAS